MFGLLQAPAGFDFPLVTAMAAFIALPVKLIVDTIKGAVPIIPPAALPLVGLVVGFAFAVLVLVAAEKPFAAAVLAQCAIAAVMAQIAAMAATWNQSRVEKVDEKIEQALKMSRDSTVADVNAAVKAKEN